MDLTNLVWVLSASGFCALLIALLVTVGLCKFVSKFLAIFSSPGSGLRTHVSLQCPSLVDSEEDFEPFAVGKSIVSLQFIALVDRGKGKG